MKTFLVYLGDRDHYTFEHDDFELIVHKGSLASTGSQEPLLLEVAEQDNLPEAGGNGVAGGRRNSGRESNIVTPRRTGAAFKRKPTKNNKRRRIR